MTFQSSCVGLIELLNNAPCEGEGLYFLKNFSPMKWISMCYVDIVVVYVIEMILVFLILQSFTHVNYWYHALYFVKSNVDSCLFIDILLILGGV